MLPTNGRVMLYKDSKQSDQMLSAMVAYVWDDGDLVNLAVNNKHGNVFGVTSVTVFQGASSECPDGQCCWMDYQRNQHLKHDNLVLPDADVIETPLDGAIPGQIEMNNENDEMLERDADAELERKMNSDEDSIESSEDVSDESSDSDNEDDNLPL